MAAQIDIANLTDEEISALATRCLDALSLAERIQAILKSMHSDDDREELKLWIDDPDQEEEEDEDADLGDPEEQS